DMYAYVFHNVLAFFLFFFFSSRRRHTRSKRDWSSDVCSSDLCAVGGGDVGGVEEIFCAPGDAVERAPVFAGSDFGVGFFGLRKRSEERRVGKECRSRGWAYHLKEK